MDPSATPWRVLEDPGEQRLVARAQAESPATPPTGSQRVLLLGGAVICLIVVAVVLAFGAGASGTVLVEGGSPLGSMEGGVAAGSDAEMPSSAPDLVVEIVGAIERPGVFRLPPGSRVGDLVNAAGGYGSRVDASRASRELNLAALLHDGDQVRVPSRDDEVTAAQTSNDGSATGSGAGSTGSTAGPLDLNRATSSELEALPGIGPVTAAKILTARDEQPFGAIEDLRTRGLLGEKTYEKVKDLVTVR